MSSIVPNGQIRFLTQIPIDANYENSLDFLSEVEQRTYFLSQQPVHTMLGATRIRDGVIAVNSLADNLLSANYMMFQNTNFSNKWFYAFITNIEYVNNNMSHVYYQIDDIQTWLFDVQLAQCFVEREHTATDGLFEHLVDEGLGVSEYIVDSREDYYMKNTSVIIFSASKLEVDPETGETEIVDSVPHFYEGYLSGVGSLQYHVMDEDETIRQSGLDSIYDDITAMTLAQQNDSICAGICFPDKLTEVSGSGARDNKVAHPDTMTFPARSNTLNGYTPKNKKMFNSPYCIYKLCCSDGQQSVLQPEMFTHPTNVQVAKLYPAVTPNPSVLGAPLDYGGEIIAFTKALSYDGFPQFAMSIDGFKAWIASGGLAKTMLSTTASIASDILVGTGSAVTGNAVGVTGAVVKGVSDVANAVITIDKAKTLPNEVKGSIDATPLMTNNSARFYTTYSTIKSDVAKSIDDYFTMFGYKVNKLKQPSRRNRPHFTYLKTKGLHVNGGAPADAIQRIETIYDNGIRFWVNPAEVGNYNVNNAPV